MHNLTGINDIWVPSRFNVIVNLPDKRNAVFNTFTTALVILDREVIKQYLELNSKYNVCGNEISDISNVLYSKGFLVPINIDELDLVRSQYLASRYSSETRTVTITPTLACNLCCPYCFEGKVQETNNEKTMSRETEIALINYLIKLLRGIKRLNINWFGGEPLLAMETIVRISSQLIPVLNKLRIRYRSSIMTNGTLLNKQIVEQLVNCQIDLVQVTIDIPKTMKNDKFGRNTLEKVLDGTKKTSEKLKVNLRINLVEDDEAEFDNLYSSLLERDLHNKLNSIGIMEVRAAECGRSECNFSNPSHSMYVNATRRERLKAKSLGIPIAHYGFVSPGACNATRESFFAIDPNGLIYKCEHDLGITERAYGSVFLPYLKMENLLPWLKYDWFNYEMCKACLVLPQCAGGCPHMRIFQSNGLSDQDFCYWRLRDDLKNRIYEYAIRKIENEPNAQKTGNPFT